ncbi:ABC transporter substrate-binding protein [Plantibacter sp. MMLR14_011]|uniref:ABC transporter substrate-binding protein n=1 Tax=Plantibacter sp. MMLR14_011 TaxID=1898746 RepID=UPI0008DCACBA|nr:ABC transporter substrate-binding protein [Plantibacter sp. MMLR14_011]OII38839.1 sugar ABC transporter substrate-binding protein [Plantibacter sp. MMLR14_011]
MKRVLPMIAVVATTILALSACSGSAGPSTSVSPAPGDDEKITLTVWSGFADAELDVVNGALDGFHKLHPNITIKSEGSQDDDKISQSIRGGTAPDVAISSNANALGQYCQSGAFQDLAGYIKRDDVDLDQIPKAVQSYTQYDGVRCAMPLLADDYGLYYNKELFAKAGITEPPKTMSELRDVAEKLTEFNPDGSIKVAGFVPTIGFYNNRLDVWAPQFGADWQDEDGKSSLSSSPGWKDLFTWQQEMTDFYGQDKLTAFTAAAGQKYSADNAFQTGQIAMMFDGEFRTGFVETQAPGIDFATAPLPVADDLADTYGGSDIGGNIIGIPKGAKHAGAAWELIKYLTTETAPLVELANGLKNIPTTFDALQSPDLQFTGNLAPFLEIFQNEHSSSLPPTANGGAFLKTASDFAVKWQTGGVSDLDKGLADVDQQITNADSLKP